MGPKIGPKRAVFGNEQELSLKKFEKCKMGKIKKNLHVEGIFSFLFSQKFRGGRTLGRFGGEYFCLDDQQ